MAMFNYMAILIMSNKSYSLNECGNSVKKNILNRVGLKLSKGIKK